MTVGVMTVGVMTVRVLSVGVMTLSLTSNGTTFQMDDSYSFQIYIHYMKVIPETRRAH